jgi:hypothetical protein
VPSFNFHRPYTWFCSDLESTSIWYAVIFLSHYVLQSHIPSLTWLTRFFPSNTRIFCVSRNFIRLMFLSWFIDKLLQTWNSLVFLISNISTVWYSPPLVTAEIIFDILHLSWMPKIHQPDGRLFSDFLHLSQFGTSMFPSLPAPCQPKFGLLPHAHKISSVICSCSGSKNFISLHIRQLSWLSVFHQPYILILSRLPVFYRLYVLLLIWIPKLNQSGFRFLLWVPHSYQPHIHPLSWDPKFYQPGIRL